MASRDTDANALHYPWDGWHLLKPTRMVCPAAPQMQELVEGSLGGWAAPPGAPPTLPSPQLPDQAAISGRIFLVDFPGSTQTSVAVGEPGALAWQQGRSEAGVR